ncbi:MAG: sn-glycerol-1-phosphate dehydrogenase [Ruminococcaceae bacterium]|nr:sn-glycerol-1-phosphate dehydrogenase [Oscillospiraceae bacterium]
MIIDGKNYSGLCSCGREHAMTTEFCVVESGCLKDIEKYTDKYKLSGYSVAIYDENTYRAEGLVRPRADKEIILPAKDLHADNHGVALAMAEIPEETGYLIAVGSGTVHDITRYCAYTKGIDFVSCPTAASVDGFCSSVAAMTWDGAKKTLTAVAPKIVVADLDVIAKAPIRLALSGMGDMIGKYVALTEWRIGKILKGEYFCDRIYDMTLSATDDVIKSADGVKRGDPDAFAKLTYGLLMSGLAMQMLGNSRCASGAEHHLSHFIEMKPEGFAERSDALHGEKVGVCTLIVYREYLRLAAMRSPELRDYPLIGEEEIYPMFGEALSAQIKDENSKDAAGGIKAEELEAAWGDIAALFEELPTLESLEAIYRELGIKSTLEDIEVDEKKIPMMLDFAPFVRNRLTLLRLRRMIVNK